MTTILVGVDPAAPAHEAIAFARALADAEGADLQHVSAHRGESAAQLLHQRAEATDARLVVLGSSHTGRLGRVIPGSTGERLLHGAPCAVAVVPRGHVDRPIDHIGVAYDASPEAEAALTHATELARHLGATLDLIGVANPDPYEDDDSARTVQVRLERALRTLPFDVDGTIVRLHGEPADALAIHSADLDLLVTGSRGYGPLRSVIVGAVSGRLMRTARCPVIVVPRAVAAPTP
ncbi:universal stress protein [Solirubrobacter phytolaccae]|uniref:Universal stress protein n=1 Tax=Solirubrobacter phytolaccae TaxID=1404360 RepID=A0A9X3SB25_9ACTN|nr:universal stress protein [Solirubrobacter phytolaccae]MDA0183156.1 universal stress protein [Solirubrobacter phytolaccae]